MTNCSVQKSKKEEFDGMKIVVGMQMTVLKSPKKFSIGDDVRSEVSSLSGSVDTLAIKGISGLAVNQHVNVTGNMLESSLPFRLCHPGITKPSCSFSPGLLFGNSQVFSASTYLLHFTRNSYCCLRGENISAELSPQEGFIHW